MTDREKGFESEDEVVNIGRGDNPVGGLLWRLYRFLASSRLAMALLVAILLCCLTGVTVFREQKAGEMIFGTLWFNALLVLLVVNVACCFFGRIWGRRVTIISFGMILFHLSFVTMFLGVVYNSLFYFRANIRLSEGETLANADPQSYDLIEKGRFFSFARLKGSTSLIRMHRDYKVAGEDKRAAYEVAVGDGPGRKQGMIYATHNLEYRGFTYFPDKEGYSLLTVLSDRNGRELYGAVLPLQSLISKDKKAYLYTTGTREAAAGVFFPQGELQPLYDLQVAYRPSDMKERAGEVGFEVRRLPADQSTRVDQPFAAGRVAVGEHFPIGEHSVSVKEVRYWVGMKICYEPGQPIVLSSLWVGLAGMIITTAGRFRRGRAKGVLPAPSAA